MIEIIRALHALKDAIIESKKGPYGMDKDFEDCLARFDEAMESLLERSDRGGRPRD